MTRRPEIRDAVLEQREVTYTTRFKHAVVDGGVFRSIWTPTRRSMAPCDRARFPIWLRRQMVLAASKFPVRKLP